MLRPQQRTPPVASAAQVWWLPKAIDTTCSLRLSTPIGCARPCTESSPSWPSSLRPQHSGPVVVSAQPCDASAPRPSSEAGAPSCTATGCFVTAEPVLPHWPSELPPQQYHSPFDE